MLSDVKKVLASCYLNSFNSILPASYSQPYTRVNSCVETFNTSDRALSFQVLSFNVLEFSFFPSFCSFLLLADRTSGK